MNLKEFLTTYLRTSDMIKILIVDDCGHITYGMPVLPMLSLVNDHNIYTLNDKVRILSISPRLYSNAGKLEPYLELTCTLSSDNNEE